LRKLAIIPARYASTRFPGKPLVDLAGKSMIRRVYERVWGSNVFDEVLIATDDARILAESESFGAKVVLTDINHISGTDRCLEAYQKLNSEFDVLVNVQGDEPFVDAEMLKDLCQLFEKESVEIATAVRPFEKDDLENPNKVKAILKKTGEVYSFSRELKPIPRDASFVDEYFKHIGVYAFRPETLSVVSTLDPSTSELKERLEQLRWMDNGHKIHAIVTTMENPAVDTPEDLENLLHWMRENDYY